ncbi:MAG: sacsin N-terminal ATP-binding-like domain-containing protein, partial [Actinomycetes bacterium]
MPDPFDTTALRAAVLDSWASSPTRFREDANAEEDLRLGGYADAWFVELAQNAADAGGGAGRVQVTVVDGEQRVANTGSPLTAAGVAALASLRASAKRDDAGSVGRFGVGFAATLAVTAEPRVVSTSGSVAFSAARTAAEVAALPGPAAELARRDEPPVLRLVWPTEEQPPAGFDTEVRMPLRPGLDAATLLEHARASAPDLLLALAGLVEIDVAGTVVRRVDGPAEGLVTIGARRWLLARRSGELADDVQDQAVEQRGRREWAVTWALPLSADDEPEPVSDDVAHAPTATLERLALPARLLATLPLEPDRRHVRKGPVTDLVLDAAAAAYLDLVRA